MLDPVRLLSVAVLAVLLALSSVWQLPQPASWLPLAERRGERSVAAQLGLPPDLHVELQAFHTVDGLPQDIAQFKTVFWESADTDSLRARLLATSLDGKQLLEIGSGSGLLSLCALQAGADRVVATDINPFAVANTYYNAELLGWGDRLDVRWVSATNSSAFAVVGDERFDLVISNPPWEDGQPLEYADHAFYDPSFQLLDSLLKDLRNHLRPGGRCLLAYGCKAAIETAFRLAEQYELRIVILDPRPLDDLPPNFLPGMLLEIE